MKYPDKKEFTRYGLERPDFRRRRWRRWGSKNPIGTAGWWVDVGREMDWQTAEDRMVHHCMGKMLEKVSLKMPLAPGTGKTVRFTRLLSLEDK